MSQTMSQMNWKPIKAALMSYYTRPIMWIPFAIILLIVTTSIFTINKNVVYVDNLDSTQSIMESFLMFGIYYPIIFIIFFIHVNSLFTNPQSRTFPGYGESHLAVTGSLLILTVISLSVPLWIFGVSLLKSAGIIFGIFSLYSSVLLFRTSIQESFSFLIVFIMLPLFLFPFFIRNREFQKGSLYGLNWYFFESNLAVYIVIGLGCMIFYFAGKRIISFSSYVHSRDTILDFSSYLKFMESSRRKHESKSKQFNKLISKQFKGLKNLDINLRKDRLQLWKIGTVPTTHLPVFMFPIFWIFFTHFMTPERSSGPGSSTSLGMSSVIVFTMQLLAFRYGQYLLPWLMRFKDPSFDFLKPVDSRIIKQDLYFVLLKHILSMVLIDAGIITFMVYWSTSHLTASDLLFTYFSCFALLMLPNMFLIYTIQNRVRVLWYILIYFNELLLISIPGSPFHHQGGQWNQVQQIAFPAAVLLIASLICFLTYRKWQNMEWGAKG